MNKKFWKSLFVGLLLLLPSLGWSATYYVTETEQGGGGGAAYATSDSLATFNTGAAPYDNLDDDTVYFCDTIRGTITVPDGGTDGHVVMLRGDYPDHAGIITGADEIEEWTIVGETNVYQAACDWTARVLIEDTTLMNFKTWNTDIATTDLSVGEWTLDTTGDLIYAYCSDGLDPDTHTMQVGVRGQAILINQSYVTVSDLLTEGSNEADYGGNIFINGAGHPGNVIIDNVESRWSANSGIAIGVNDTYYTSGSITIRNCTLHHNLKAGFAAVEDVGSTITEPSLIQNCTVYNNLGDGIVSSSNYWTIENNLVHDSGFFGLEHLGIHIYSPASDSGVGFNNTIRYNKVYNTVGGSQDGSGIGIDQWCDYNDVYGNIIYHSDGPGIYLYDASYCNLYNNTIYESCLDSAGDLISPGSIRLTGTGTNTNIKNNNVYSTETGDYAIFVVSTYFTGLVITNNNWYRATGSWYWYNTATGSDLATWNAFTEVGTDLNSDPLFTNAAGGDFTLKYNSPCEDAGFNLGSSYDDAFDPRDTTFPYDTVDQDLYGSGWEIGAFAYLGGLSGIVRDWDGNILTGGAKIYAYEISVAAEVATVLDQGYVGSATSNSTTGVWMIDNIAEDEYMVIFEYYGTHGGKSKIAGAEFMSSIDIGVP